MCPNSLSFSCFWVSGVWSCDMWPETTSTAFLCKARWGAPWLEGAASVCLWKRAQAFIERVPRTHPTIKSVSFSVHWVKLQLEEFTTNESVFTAEEWSVLRFVPGELSVCWHNRGSVSEIRHLILESRLRAGCISCQGKDVLLLTTFIRNKADNRMEEGKLHNLSRTSSISCCRSSSDVPRYHAPLLHGPWHCCFLIGIRSWECKSTYVLCSVYKYSIQVQRIYVYTARKEVHRIRLAEESKIR